MLASFSMASPAPFRCLQWHIRQRPSRPARLLARAAKDDSRWRPLSLSEKLQQPLQLLVAIWLLLLLPAGLAMSPRQICGGLVLGSLPFEYLAFFLVGTVPRAWRYGSYARPARKGKPGTRPQDFLFLLLALFLAHILAVVLFVQQHRVLSFGWKLPRFVAMVLTGTAAWHLGRNYDRVAVSSELVTTGPYRLVRHPIYTSYLILFISSLLDLQSWLGCGILSIAALLFYSRRITAEEEILKESFGEKWDAFTASTRFKLIPFIY